MLMRFHEFHDLPLAYAQLFNPLDGSFAADCLGYRLKNGDMDVFCLPALS